MVFIPNPRFIPEMREEDEVKEVLEESAGKAAEIARTIAPYDPDDPMAVTEGHYRDKFVVVRGGGEVFLGNTNYKAHWIEWGTSGGGRGNISTPAFGVIRRAVLSAGYKLDESESTHT